jgi:hypothetical protein
VQPLAAFRFHSRTSQAFIPSVQIFGLSDTIPIHLLISGALSSVRELILPSSPVLDHEIDYGNSPVRVNLTRMITFEYGRNTTWRTIRIGTGRFRPLPPDVDFECRCEPVCKPPQLCSKSFHWDGEVQCDHGIETGGFHAAGLTVKASLLRDTRLPNANEMFVQDFITVELIPPKPSSSPLLTVQHGIPIRFTTESFLADA